MDRVAPLSAMTYSPPGSRTSDRGDTWVDGTSRAAQDARLVAQVRNGDQEAFGALYAAHVRAVNAAVYDRVRDAETRADVVQECFVRALKRLDHLRDPASFRPWLLAIARNTAVDHVRAERNADAEEEALQALPDPVAGPDDLAEFAELATQVRDGLVRLSRRDATALTMALQLGLSTQELAVALGVSPGAAKVALHRARQRLRQALRLQVLVRTRGGACDELRKLYDAGDLPAAVRHLGRCEVGCSTLDEVEGFTAGAVTAAQ